MSNVVRLAHTQRDPQTRACNTCRHAPTHFSGFTRCKATGNYVDVERMSGGYACGMEGRLWEPIPPRLGLFGWIRVLLFGEKRHD
jgi:hypothetical protein